MRCGAGISIPRKQSVSPWESGQTVLAASTVFISILEMRLRRNEESIFSCFLSYEYVGNYCKIIFVGIHDKASDLWSLSNNS